MSKMIRKCKNLVLVVFVSLFVACDPVSCYDTLYFVRIFYNAKNEARTGIVLELYRYDGWEWTHDTAAWNEEHPRMWSLTDNDVFVETNGSFSIRRVRTEIEYGEPMQEVYSSFGGECSCNFESRIKDTRGWLTIYNLQDTSRYSFSVYEEGMPFVEHVWMQDTTDMRPRADYVSEFYITITDSDLAAMQKDYSMLEKFPQYYGTAGK